jgi:hypothetical protein
MVILAVEITGYVLTGVLGKKTGETGMQTGRTLIIRRPKVEPSVVYMGQASHFRAENVIYPVFDPVDGNPTTHGAETTG